MAVAGMALLMVAAFRGDSAVKTVGWLTVGCLIVAALLVLSVGSERQAAFSNLFVVDGFAAFCKILILAGSALAIVTSLGYVEREQIGRAELPVLLLLSTLGMMCMVSANDFMSLYIGLELQSLAIYVVAAIKRDTVRSSEAGLKYFVLGALSSGLLLYGVSLIYGFSGSTNFTQLAAVFAGDAPPPLGIVVGIVFVCAALAFKVSAVPFHMWTPDVYEGAPTPVTAFIASAPKVAALALFVRVLVGPFGGLAEQWQQIIWVVSVGSMMLGAFAAIAQTNIKRLLAYSSIGHMGYALMGLVVGNEAGIKGLLVYVAIYLFMNLGAFAIVHTMRVGGRALEDTRDLAGLSRTHPLLALAFAIFMFSMAGIPPLAGFFSKIYVFLPAIQGGWYVLAVIGVLTSCVSAYYYLRIVKLMYFDDAAEAFDGAFPVGTSAVLVITATFTTLFIVYPTALTASAEAAAAALGVR